MESRGAHRLLSLQMNQLSPSPRRSATGLDADTNEAIHDALQSREQRRHRALSDAGLTTTRKAVPTADPEPSPSGDDSAESECVSLQTRYSNRTHWPNSTPNTGVDTVHLFTDDFRVSDRPALTVEDRTDMETGAGDVVPLFRPGSPDAEPVHGRKAYHNDALAQITVYGHAALSVQAALPKHLREDNSDAVSSDAELTLALSSLERHLQRLGIRTNLHSARVTRLDLCRTVDLQDSIDAYEPALRSLTFPRTDRTRYEGTGFKWANGSRQVVLYDKGLEQTGERSRTARLEYRLTGSEAVKQHSDLQTAEQLLEHMSDVDSTFQKAAERLFSAEPATDATTTEEGFRAVLEALDGQHGASTKTLLAFAVNRMTADEREQLIQAVKEKQGRTAAYRLQQKFDDLQGAASVFDRASRSEAALYRELRSAFLDTAE